jgi:hypothetical protein
MERETPSCWRIVVKGRLGERWGGAFGGLAVQACESNTALVGTLADQAHLHGVLEQLRRLGIELLAVNRLE